MGVAIDMDLDIDGDACATDTSWGLQLSCGASTTCPSLCCMSIVLSGSRCPQLLLESPTHFGQKSLPSMRHSLRMMRRVVSSSRSSVIVASDSLACVSEGMKPWSLMLSF